jgi:hypothetical protein
MFAAARVYLVAHVVAQYRLAIFAGRGRFRLALGIGVNGGGSKHTE